MYQSLAVRLLRICSLLAIWLAVLGQAQSLSNLPSCAYNCVVTAVDDQTQCSATDASCLCQDSALGTTIGYCMGYDCDAADIDSALVIITEYCDSVKTGTGTAAATGNAFASAANSGATETPITAAGGGSSSSGSGSGSSSIHKKKTGLSAGGKAGIGVGSTAAVLLAAALGVWRWWIAHKKKKGQDNLEAQGAKEQSVPNDVQPPVTMVNEKVEPQVEVQEYFPPSQTGHGQPPTNYIPQQAMQPPSQMASAVYNQQAPPYGQPQPPVSPMSTHAQPVPVQNYAAQPPPQYGAPPGQQFPISPVPVMSQPYQPPPMPMPPYQMPLYQAPPPAMTPAPAPTPAPTQAQAQAQVHEVPAHIAPPQGNFHEAPA